MILNKVIPNWINGKAQAHADRNAIEKYNPHTGLLDSTFVDSGKNDVDLAVEAAHRAFQEWSKLTPVERGDHLTSFVKVMEENKEVLSAIVARETGKSLKDAEGEVNASIKQGRYFAGEGMRLFGRSLTSGIPGKYSHTVRQPVGVAGLIVPANTPIANIAWKIFPALICGNSVVLKASEDSPEIAYLMGELSTKAGIPDGVVNVLQGKGDPVGMAIVEHTDIPVISFTGSTSVGRWIAKTAGERLAKVSLELGGKNPFIVCDDADLDQAAHWAVLSAFSNAGQRCAAGSRILVFQKIYDEFVSKLITKTKELSLGIHEGSNLGPVINKKQQLSILASVDQAVEEGGEILTGGGTPAGSLASGYYIEPTIIAGLNENAYLSVHEIFGPVATLHPISDLQDALRMSNSSQYGLTAAIHTKSVDRAMWFAQRVKAGVVNVNIGTFGSEAHMPFGGFGASGNGTREPGVEALDIYTELKNISFLVRDSLL